MAAEKYGKYVTKGVTNPPIQFPEFRPVKGPLSFKSSELFKGSEFRLNFECISSPVVMDPFPLKHMDADQITVFKGSNPMDLDDFDAEIEFCLGVGDEQEKYVITSPTMIFVPRGTAHTPLNFKRIGKPLMFCNFTFGNYTRLLFRDNEWKQYKDIYEEREGTPWELPEA